MPVIVALFLIPGLAGASDWRDGAKGYDQGIFEQQHTQLPMVVYFRTEWCPHCKALDANVLTTPKVAGFLDAFVKVRINPETGSPEEKLAKTFGISGYPSMFVVVPGGKPVKLSASENMSADSFIRGVRNIAGDPAKPKVAAAVPTATPLKVERPGEVTNAIDPEILALQNAGRNEEAVSRLTQEIKRAERNGVSASPPLYYARALSYRALHEHSKAAEDLTHWIKAHPDDAKARETLARSYLNLTMYDDASRELGELVKDHPTGELLFLLAEADTKRGKPDEAKPNYAASCKAGYKAACGK